MEPLIETIHHTSEFLPQLIRLMLTPYFAGSVEVTPEEAMAAAMNAMPDTAQRWAAYVPTGIRAAWNDLSAEARLAVYAMAIHSLRKSEASAGLDE